MLNKVFLMGRFTKDPELRATQQGESVLSFSLAVDRDYKGQNEERKTDFINCVAWRKTAEFISKYFHRGNLATIEGSIETRSWENNEGKKNYATEVKVNNIYFCESKKDVENDVSVPPVMPMGEDDDLPF